MRTTYRRIVPIVLLLCGLCAGRCYGQLFIGAGFEYGVPVITGKQTFVKTDPIGLYGNVGCRLHTSRIFPSFSWLIKTIKLPVYNATYNGLQAFATNNDFALNLNYKLKDEDSYSALFAGIGAARIVPENGLTDNYGNPLTLRDTGSQNLYPMVQVGIKYMHRIVPNGNFYIGLEACLRYIYMHGDNRYYLQNNTILTPATIAGDIYFPSVLVHLDYIFERRREQ